MIDTHEVNAVVYELLAQSRWARKGAEEAHMAGDVAAEARLYQKSRAKLKEAESTDPGRRCEAWADHLRGTN